jgi:predicted DNA-binding transcriptional regulator YafY
MTAGQLAAELEVSPRTVLRDIEALSAAGVPVYPVRGCLGGFELLDGFRSDLPAAHGRNGGPAGERARGLAVKGAQSPAGDKAERARIRLSPRGRRLAALLGRPPDIRVRRSRQVTPGREDWTEAWVRIDSADVAVLDMLALGTEVEVLHPPGLRAGVREAASRIVALHSASSGRPPVPRAKI